LYQIKTKYHENSYRKRIGKARVHGFQPRNQ
jgi:hypothetical protein